MIQLKCFHGTSYSNAQSILHEQHFRSSDSDSLRMGKGAYFFCQSGKSAEYPIRCARELESYHINSGKHTDGYAILSCIIECNEENYLDLFVPENLEYFHQMRYTILNKTLEKEPDFKYHNAAVADTQVFDIIRKIRSLEVIRCPQFFGMLAEEQKFQFDKGQRPFPKTYLPNVIMVYADTDTASIREIELVEGRKFNYEYEGTV